MTAQEYAITTADWLLKKAGLPTYSKIRQETMIEAAHLCDNVKVFDSSCFDCGDKIRAKVYEEMPISQRSLLTMRNHMDYEFAHQRMDKESHLR